MDNHRPLLPTFPLLVILVALPALCYDVPRLGQILRHIGHHSRIQQVRVRPIQNRALEKLRAGAERVGSEPSLLLGM